MLKTNSCIVPPANSQELSIFVLNLYSGTCTPQEQDNIVSPPFSVRNEVSIVGKNQTSTWASAGNKQLCRCFRFSTNHLPTGTTCTAVVLGANKRRHESFVRVERNTRTLTFQQLWWKVALLFYSFIYLHSRRFHASCTKTKPPSAKRLNDWDASWVKRLPLVATRLHTRYVSREGGISWCCPTAPCQWWNVRVLLAFMCMVSVHILVFLYGLWNPFWP